MLVRHWCWGLPLLSLQLVEQLVQSALHSWMAALLLLAGAQKACYFCFGLPSWDLHVPRWSSQPFGGYLEKWFWEAQKILLPSCIASGPAWRNMYSCTFFLAIDTAQPLLVHFGWVTWKLPGGDHIVLLGCVGPNITKVCCHGVDPQSTWVRMAFLLHGVEQDSNGLFLGVFLQTWQAHGPHPVGKDLHPMQGMAKWASEFQPVFLGKVRAEILKIGAFGSFGFLVPLLGKVAHSLLDLGFGLVGQGQGFKLGQKHDNALAIPLAVALDLLAEAGQHGLEVLLHVG